MSRAAALCAVCAIVAALVAADEIGYWHTHRYAPGPSLQVGILAVLVAVLAGCVSWALGEIGERHRADDRRHMLEVFARNDE